RTLPVLQMLDWSGPWGLTCLIALVNASLAAAIRSGHRLPAVSRQSGSDREGRRLSAVGCQSGKDDLAFTVSRQPTADSLDAWRWLAGTALLIALLSARGAWLLAQPTDAGSQGSARSGANTTLPVAVVQGDINQDTEWDARYIQRAMEAHSRLTRDAARAGARLIIGSETSLPGELRY